MRGEGYTLLIEARGKCASVVLRGAEGDLQRPINLEYKAAAQYAQVSVGAYAEAHTGHVSEARPDQINLNTPPPPAAAASAPCVHREPLPPLLLPPLFSSPPSQLWGEKISLLTQIIQQWNKHRRPLVAAKKSATFPFFLSTPPFRGSKG